MEIFVEIMWRHPNQHRINIEPFISYHFMKNHLFYKESLKGNLATSGLYHVI